MEGEIINRVKDSGLINLDLAHYKPNRNLVKSIDIADNLWQGLVLKEKDFREYIKNNDWNEYSGKYVYIHCSTDAIIPTWAYMLVMSKLIGVAKRAVVGSEVDLLKEIITENIEQIDLEPLQDGRLIIKGCSDIPEPAFAMSVLVQKLQPVVKSMMYGEPCSTVPIYKRR